MRERAFGPQVMLCILFILGFMGGVLPGMKGCIPILFYIFVFIINKSIGQHLSVEQKDSFLDWDSKAPSVKILGSIYVACKKSIK